jgi:hypothetical protein
MFSHHTSIAIIFICPSVPHLLDPCLHHAPTRWRVACMLRSNSAIQCHRCSPSCQAIAPTGHSVPCHHTQRLFQVTTPRWVLCTPCLVRCPPSMPVPATHHGLLMLVFVVYSYCIFSFSVFLLFFFVGYCLIGSCCITLWRRLMFLECFTPWQ